MNTIRLIFKRKELKKIRTNIFYNFLLSLLIYGMAIIPSIMMKLIIDSYIPTNDTLKVLLGILIIVIVPLLTASIKLLMKVVVAVKSKKVGNEMSVDVFNVIMKQPYSFFKDSNTNELVTYCNKNFHQYISYWLSEVPIFFSNIVIAVIYFTIIARVNYLFIPIMLLFLPVLYIPTTKIGNMIGGKIKYMVASKAMASSIMGDAFRGIKIVKTNQLYHSFTQRLKKVNNEIEKHWKSVAILDNLSGIWMNEFVSNLFVGMILSIGIYLFYLDSITIGSLFLIVGIAGGYFSIVHQVIYNRINYEKISSEHNQLFSFLELKGDNDDGSIQLDKVDKVEFKNVEFSYGTNNVINNLSFKGTTGCWIGIEGQSGAGKSTILNLMLRLIKPDKGSIIINSNELNELSIESYLKHVSYISQDTFVFNGTIRDNFIMMQEDIEEDDIYSLLSKVKLKDMVIQLPNKLDTNIGENGFTISGGERQRLSIAMALIKLNKLILLDEVTSNVDKETEDIIRSLFYDLVKKGHIILSVSHNPDFHTHVSEKVMLVNNNETYNINETQLTV